LLKTFHKLCRHYTTEKVKYKQHLDKTMEPKARIRIDFIAMPPTNQISEIRTLDLNDGYVTFGRGFAPRFNKDKVEIQNLIHTSDGKKIIIADWKDVTDKISRMHLLIRWDPKIQKYSAINRGTHGTLFNGVKAKKCTPLIPGTIISFPATDPRIIITFL
jgi:hypothetical protein